VSNTVSCEGNSVNNKNDCRAKHDKFEYIVHQKLFYITGICIFSVHVKDKSTAQHVLPEQKDNGSSSFAGKTYKFQLHNSFLV
jgi:hypothetical protein